MLQNDLEKQKRKEISQRVRRRRALDYLFLFILIALIAGLVMILFPVLVRIVTDSND